MIILNIELTDKMANSAFVWTLAAQDPFCAERGFLLG